MTESLKGVAQAAGGSDLWGASTQEERFQIIRTDSVSFPNFKSYLIFYSKSRNHYYSQCKTTNILDRYHSYILFYLYFSFLNHSNISLKYVKVNADKYD